MSGQPPSPSQFWTLHRPHLPPRSRLFHVQPIGIGTLFAESLMGYIVRLADYHCVTPRMLVLKEIAPQMLAQGYPAPRWRQRLERLFTPYSPLIKGNEVSGITVKALLQALEELTQQHGLTRLALLRRASTLVPTSHLRRTQAWCPLCLELWHRAQCSIYTPLIWLLQNLRICPQHPEQELLEHCQHCQQSFPPLASNLSPGVCPKCHNWLGSPTPIENPFLAPQEETLWSPFIRTSYPLEEQLAWLDDAETLIRQASLPFYPPHLPWLSGIGTGCSSSLHLQAAF